MTFTRKILSAVLVIGITLFTACKKDFDTVPVKELPEGNIITIDSLRKIYTAFDTTITNDISIYGVVTADAVTGNIYKELYIQDETNAIKLELLSSADFFIGDRVRVAIKGATVRRDRDMIVLDSINPDIAIIRQEQNQDLTPEVVTIDSLILIDIFASKYQGKLVQINNVEFDCADACKTWADGIGQRDENRVLIDTMGNSIVVRSSGFSTFAGDNLPFDQGSIVGVVSQYDGTVQLTIRNPNEFIVSNTRKSTCTPCPAFTYTKDFEDESITSGGWIQQNIAGNISWEASDQGSHPSFYGRISNYNGSSNVACETWLVSPAFDLSNTTNPEFFMESDVNYSGADLEVYITTNFTGDVTTTSWTQLSVPLDPDNSGWNTFYPSGAVSLVSYKSSGVRVAYKYVGSSSNGQTCEIDDIKIIDL
ncbi:MAG: DUF5689 domain-containing protein [Vicingaceae bacterium]|nr:DUF5689 domain-containing protein [Vicingaceae bacterium]